MLDRYHNELPGKILTSQFTRPLILTLRGSTKLCGIYIGLMRMVITEFIEGTTVDGMTSLPSDAQIVFGDPQGSQGQAGEAHYHRNVSTRVQWPESAEG